MFGSKKRLMEIKEARNELENEKKELLFIKKLLEDQTPKIDISNVFVWYDNGLYSLVRLEVKKIKGKNCFGNIEDGYESNLIDIFSNCLVYRKTAVDTINSKEYVSTGEGGRYANLYPIHKFYTDILVYADKKVPLYVLQQLYYRLNNVDVNVYKLEKKN